MDLADLRLRTLAYLQDPDNKKWGATVLDAAINFANSWAWKKYCLNTQGSHGVSAATAQSIVAGTQEYALPTDMLRFFGLKRVNLSAPNEPYWVERLADVRDAPHFRNWFGPNDRYPSMFYLLGSVYGLAPKPATSIADAMQVFYFADAAELSDGADVPEIPTAYHDMLALRAAIRMLRLDETEPSTIIYELNEQVAEMIHAISEGGEQAETSPIEFEY